MQQDTEHINSLFEGFVFEDYFDRNKDALDSNFTPDVQDEFNKNDEDYKYYMRVDISVCRRLGSEWSVTRELMKHPINVNRGYRAIEYILEQVPFFKSYKLGDKIRFYDHLYNEFDPVEFKYPCPELFNIGKWYDQPSNWSHPSGRDGCFEYFVYFDALIDCDHRTFTEHMNRLLTAFQNVRFDTNGSVSLHFKYNNGLGGSAVSRQEERDPDVAVDPDRFEFYISPAYCQNQNRIDALYKAFFRKDDTSLQVDDGYKKELQRMMIIRKVNLPAALRYAEEKGPDYGLKVTAGTYHLPEPEEFSFSSTRNACCYVALTIEPVDKSVKNLEIYDIETFVINTIIKRFNIVFFDLCHFTVAVRCMVKPTNEYEEEIKRKYKEENPNEHGVKRDKLTFYHDKDTPRAIYTKRIDIRNYSGGPDKKCITAKECGFSHHSLTSFRLLVADKNGRVCKEPENFTDDHLKSAQNYQLFDKMLKPEFWKPFYKSKINEDWLDRSSKEFDDDEQAAIDAETEVETSEYQDDDVRNYKYAFIVRWTTKDERSSLKDHPTNILLVYRRIKRVFEMHPEIVSKYYIAPPIIDDPNRKYGHVKIERTQVQFPLPTAFNNDEFFGDSIYSAHPSWWFYVCFNKFDLAENATSFMDFARHMREFITSFYYPLQTPDGYGTTINILRLFGGLDNAGNVCYTGNDENSYMYFTGMNDNTSDFAMMLEAFGRTDIIPEGAKQSHSKSEDDMKNYIVRKMFKTIGPMAQTAARRSADYDFNVTLNNYGIPDFEDNGDKYEHGFFWAAFTIDSDKKELDIYDIEHFLVNEFYSRMPYGIMRLTNLIVFLRIIPKLTDNLVDYYKQRVKSGDSSYKFKAMQYEYNNGTFKYAITEPCTYKSLPLVSDTLKKDMRTRSGYMREHNVDTKFVTVFGDKKGYVGRLPFSRRKYNDSTINNAWEFIQKEVDTGNIWK